MPRILDPEPDPAALAFAQRPSLAGRRTAFRRGELKWGRDSDDPRARLLNDRMGKAGGAELDLVALVRPGGWKYIWAEDAPDEVYYLPRDPTEKNNLRKEEPERWAAMKQQVANWWEATVPRADLGQESEEFSEGVQDMLDALGY